MGRRLLRYLLIGLGLLVLGALWAFSFFLFNPFEDAYSYPLASLISREVHFYAYKGGLGRDFERFPRLAILDEVEASPAGQALMDLGIREAIAGWDIEPALQELETTLAKLPVRVDPLAVFGGRGLAIAGNFAAPDLASAQWAVFARTSWLGKLGVALVAGGFLDLEKQGITLRPYESEGQSLGVELSGGQLQQPIYLARIQDVVIIANDGSFLAAADALEGTRGQDSLDRSAKYADNIVRTGEEGDELELYIDQRAMSEELKLAGTWPDRNSQELATALCARLFQLGTVREAVGSVDFAPTVSLDLVGELSSNVLTPFQQRLYDERGFDKDQMLETSKLVPADAGLFAYLHVDVGDFLRELRSVIMAVDPAAISNLEDVVRSAWNYPSLDPLIVDLDEALRDRVAFFVRDYDYPPETSETAPPHDDTPVLAWAVVMWPKDEGKVNAFRKVIEDSVIPMLRGEGSGSTMWDNTLQGGAKIREYWNELVPGTGHLATLEMVGRDPYLVLTNENRLLGQVFKVYTNGRSDEGLTRLADDPAFHTWVMSGLGSANCLVWAAPRTIEPSLRRISERRTQETGADSIDWAVERPRIESEVLRQHFPGERAGQISEDNLQSYELLVQEAVDRFQSAWMQQHMPEMRAESERWLRAQRAIRASFLELATDRKRLHLHGRLALEFEPASP